MYATIREKGLKSSRCFHHSHAPINPIMTIHKDGNLESCRKNRIISFLHRRSTRGQEDKEEKKENKRKAKKEVSFDMAPWVLDKGVETQVIK